ncbi:MAG: hypothetical protein KDA80_24050, partial [Planctomycetaceae bacterium]|nr:hypothetical protein [Planctomycetaceae bacterium]
MRVLLSLTAFLVLPPGTALQAEDRINFARDIRPILSANCYQCHGADDASREADLRLDVRKAAIEKQGESAAIVPGDPLASDMVRRITSEDDDIIMPPKDSGKSLKPQQIVLLNR